VQRPRAQVGSDGVVQRGHAFGTFLITLGSCVWACGVGAGTGVVCGGIGVRCWEMGYGLAGAVGVYPPLPCWSGPLTKGSTGVEAPRYPPVRERVRVAGAG